MFNNWKTTVSGIFIAAMNLWANGSKPKEVLLSIAVAIFGAVAKDFNVTGTGKNSN